MDEIAVARAKRGKLVRQLEVATRQIARGIGMLVLLPLVGLVAAAVALLFGTSKVTTIVVSLALMYAVVGGLFGLALIVAGSAVRRSAARQLREHDDVHKLPEARVVRG